MELEHPLCQEQAASKGWPKEEKSCKHGGIAPLLDLRADLLYNIARIPQTVTGSWGVIINAFRVSPRLIQSLPKGLSFCGSLCANLHVSEAHVRLHEIRGVNSGTCPYTQQGICQHQFRCLHSCLDYCEQLSNSATKLQASDCGKTAKNSGQKLLPSLFLCKGVYWVMPQSGYLGIQGAWGNPSTEWFNWGF